MKKSIIALAACIVLVCSMGFAQTVTVDASLASPDNTSTFSSLFAAMTSFQASGDATDGTDGAGLGNNHGNAAADVINIVSADVIDEAIILDAIADPAAGLHVLDEALTVQGSGVTATLALQMSSLGATGNDCGLFFRQDVDLTLKNLIIIPSKTETPTDDALYFRSTTNGTADVVITLDNILLTSNDGSDAPISTTGMESAVEADALLSATETVPWGDDGIYVVARAEGGSITCNATNVIITAIKPVVADAAYSDALMVFMSGTTSDFINAFLNLGEGCIISNIDRFGVQNPYGGKVNINGSSDNPVIFNNIASDGVWNYSDSSGATQPTLCVVNNCIINNCGGSGLKEQETAGRGFIGSVENTIIANCSGPAIELYSQGALATGATDTVTINNVTVYNCGYGVTDAGENYDFRAAGIASPTYSASGTDYKSNRNVNIRNTIIAGAGLTGIYNSADGSYDVDFSSLVTINKPGFSYKLSAQTGGASTITLGSDVISDDPCFLELFDAFSDDLMDVDNPAFAAKAVAGADLAGGADFIGGWEPPLAANGGWALYE